MLRASKRALNGSAAIPSPFLTEALAHQGFDSVTIDMQHGLVRFESALGMLQAISTTDATPLVRVPANEPGIITRRRPSISSTPVAAGFGRGRARTT